MKISEIRGEKAVEILSDLIEPFVRMCQHKELKEVANKNNPLLLGKAMVKADPKAVLEILAICNQVPVEGYNPNAFQILHDLVLILTDESIQTLFFSQQPKVVHPAFGGATEDTRADGQQADS